MIYVNYFFNLSGGYMSTTAKIKSKHKVMHKQGCFYPEANFPGLDRFSGRLVYRNGKIIGKQLKCSACDNKGKYFKNVEMADDYTGVPIHKYLSCQQPFCHNGYSKKLYSVKRQKYRYPGFTCPKCGSNYFSTFKLLSDKQYYGSCNTFKCGFKWRRVFTSKLGLQNRLSDYRLEKLCMHTKDKKAFLDYMSIITKGNTK